MKALNRFFRLSVRLCAHCFLNSLWLLSGIHIFSYNQKIIPEPQFFEEENIWIPGGLFIIGLMIASLYYLLKLPSENQSFKRY